MLVHRRTGIPFIFQRWKACTQTYWNLLYFSAAECLYTDVNFAYHNVGDFTFTNTWQQCAQRCENDPKCHAWSHFSTRSKNPQLHNHCSMKDQTFMEGKQSHIGAVSATKGCGKWGWGPTYRVPILTISDITLCHVMGIEHGIHFFFIQATSLSATSAQALEKWTFDAQKSPVA